jgi:sulfite reductase beta subunit-like hemoprotein
MEPCRAAARDRADRCPGVLRLHEAADGWMARVRLPGGRVDAAGLQSVADVAGMGNGLVELTSRASLQIRGLRPGSAERVADRLRAGGLLPSIAHDRVRNVLASPFAGRHPRCGAAVDDVVAALDRGLCADPALAGLPGRFLFAVEDGSGVAGAQRADVTLVAERGVGFRLWLAGARTTLAATAHDAPRLALDAARAFLALPRDADAAAWRVADAPGGAERLARRLGGALQPGNEVASRPLGIGALAQPDGRLAVTALAPLGRVDRAIVQRLGALVDEVRLSTARTLTIVDVPAAGVAPLTAELAALGLVTVAGSGWHGLSACAGLGACGRARVDVRAAAAARARARPAGAPAEHWSACERGCGRPVDVPVAVVAHADGLRLETFGGAQAAADVPTALALLARGPTAR